MPEGPEVRMNRDMLAETVSGKTLLNIEALSGKLERKGVPGHDEFLKYLPAKIAAVKVRGKSLLIELDNGAGIHSTLGMAGWWYPVVKDINTLTGKAYSNSKLLEIKEVVGKAYKFSRVLLHTDDGDAVFCDMRNFGNMTCYTPEQLKMTNPLDKLGVDLLNEAPQIGNWNLKWMAKKTLATKGQQNKQVGELLLDQEFACGLGNIYRAEVLYLAKVKPSRKLSELTELEWQRIGRAAPFVLSLAYVTQGVMGYPGHILRNFLDYNVPDDLVYERHLVYGRKVDPRNNPITAEEIGGRTMWWCPEIQK